MTESVTLYRCESCDNPNVSIKPGRCTSHPYPARAMGPELTARVFVPAAVPPVPPSGAEAGEGCRAPHCWSEYGTPCGTCPVVSGAEAGGDAGVWPDQSAQHAVLLEQIKDAYAEGKADVVALIRERAANALPEVARFTLDEIEAIVALAVPPSGAEAGDTT